jgi:hypothetical protein
LRPQSLETFLRLEGNDGANRHSFLSDGNNNTLRLLDGSGAKVVDYAYEPYGATMVDAANGNTQQFTGRENDNPGDANEPVGWRRRHRHGANSLCICGRCHGMVELFAMNEIWQFLAQYPIAALALAVLLSGWIGYVERRHFVRREISTTTFVYTGLLACALIVALLYAIL